MVGDLNEPGWIHPPHTYVIGNVVQQANFVQMCRGRHRECKHIPNGLVEARVGTSTQRDRQVLVLEVVLHVAHLVVNCGQLVHCDPCALLNPGVEIVEMKVMLRAGTSTLWGLVLEEHRSKEDSVLG